MDFKKGAHSLLRWGHEVLTHPGELIDCGSGVSATPVLTLVQALSSLFIFLILVILIVSLCLCPVLSFPKEKTKKKKGKQEELPDVWIGSKQLERGAGLGHGKTEDISVPRRLPWLLIQFRGLRLGRGKRDGVEVTAGVKRGRRKGGACVGEEPRKPGLGPREGGQRPGCQGKHAIVNFNDSGKSCRRPRRPDWRCSFVRGWGFPWKLCPPLRRG